VGVSATASVDEYAGFWHVLRNVPAAVVFANLKVFLEGAYAGNGLMSTNLNPANLPLAQPYGGSSFGGTPMSYAGLESVSTMPAEVVDWVLIEVRSGTAAADSQTTRAALLLDNGLIRDVDGISQVEFQGLTPASYYVVVRHRNHVPIMSNTAVPIIGSPGSIYDMSLEANIYNGVGSGAAKNLGNGVFGLYAGDANGSGGTGPEDKAAWLSENGFLGYLITDFSLSGGTGPEDKALWIGNPSVLTIVPEH
jgi:hypothetical protein